MHVHLGDSAVAVSVRPLAAQDVLITQLKYRNSLSISIAQSFVLSVLSSIYLYWRSRSPKLPRDHGIAVDPDADTGGVVASPSIVPLPLQIVVGACIAGNILFTNVATVILSYPIQVIFKSSKLLLAMAVRALIFKKPNSLSDYFAAMLLCAGLACFLIPSHSDGGHRPANEAATDASELSTDEYVTGMLCVFASLLAEAGMLNLQEHYLFERYRVTEVTQHSCRCGVVDLLLYFKPSSHLCRVVLLQEWVMAYGYLHCTIVQLVFAELSGQVGGLLRSLLSAFFSLLFAGAAFAHGLWACARVSTGYCATVLTAMPQLFVSPSGVGVLVSTSRCCTLPRWVCCECVRGGGSHPAHTAPPHS